MKDADNDHASLETCRKDIRLMFQRRLGDDFDMDVLNQVSALTAAMRGFLEVLVSLQRSERITPRVYADALNAASVHNMKLVRKVMGDDAFLRVFDTLEDVHMVDPDEMERICAEEKNK